MAKTFIHKESGTWHNIMKKHLPHFFIALYFILCSISNIAQTNNGTGSNALLAEKIYLQTDRQVYSFPDTLWFKCIVANAFDHIPTALSGVLYVELIGPTERIINKKIIKLNEGIGNGYFGLDENLQGNTYQLRAYTQWDRNFGNDFFFTQYINVFDGTTNSMGTPISSVKLVKEKGNGQQRLKACFDPFTIDSLHTNRLTVFVTTDSKTDSIKLGKWKGNKYLLDYKMADSCRFVTLKMQTGNRAQYSKTILLDQDYTDLQFFPESGELVHGLPSKVGFKAVDVNGKGIFVHGDIVDENDSVFTPFKSNALGMGSLILSEADSAKTLYARTVSKLDTAQFLLFPLPAASPLGNTLAVEREGGKILLVAASNYMKNDSIEMLVSCRGMAYFNKKVILKNGLWGGAIPADMLPEGIIACTMLDTKGQPVAERLFFNSRPGERLRIEMTTDKASYAKRELTILDIKTTNNNGMPVDANLSVLAINKEQLGTIQQTRQNILSYFLLDSELKGGIENPGFYFNSESTDDDIDALMLTQGWRKYLYSKPFGELSFEPERNLYITGRVTNGLLDKAQVAKLTMMSFGDGFQAATTMSDSTGRFRFDLGDEYGDEMTVVIQSAKKSGKKMDYIVSLDERKVPPVTFEHGAAIDKPDSVIVELVKNDEERKKVEGAYQLASGSILIGQVDVDGYRRSPESRRIIELCGVPDLVIDGKELQEKEEDWSFGLYNVLMYSNREDIEISQSYDGSSVNLRVLGSDITLVLVDGMYDRLNQDLIHTLSTNEVSSIDVIKCANNFVNIYLETTGNTLTTIFADAKFIKAIECGSIVNINTFSGKGIYQAYVTPKGVNRFRIPRFSTPKEFYEPKYENLQPGDWDKPDLRALIHWQPGLSTNEQGFASTSFYNADNVGDMMIIVEAISKEGKIGYREMEYKVEGKKQRVIIVE
ncbi:MAG: hypothetical protein JW798_17655 [Prolixibacteraceae bacterium]|nr:hypothetical protein [Prolixibacteraceae bacterium]